MSTAGGGLGRRELPLWVVSAAIVVAAHGGIAAAISAWPDPPAPGGAASAIMIEMAPIAIESAAEQANLPIAPLQEEQQAPTPEEAPEPEIEPEPEPEPVVTPEPEKIEPEVPEQVAEIPPPPEPPPPLPPTPPVPAEVTLPLEAPVKKTKRPPPKRKMMVATAPERADRVAPRQRAVQAGAARVSPNIMQSYAANVIRPHLMRHISGSGLKEGGVVVVTFTITRQGRLTGRHVSRSSGRSEIDSAALATLQRAQPFPPPPLELTQQTFMFTLPVRYNIVR